MQTCRFSVPGDAKTLWLIIKSAFSQVAQVSSEICQCDAELIARRENRIGKLDGLVNLTHSMVSMLFIMFLLTGSLQEGDRAREIAGISICTRTNTESDAAVPEIEEERKIVDV